MKKIFVIVNVVLMALGVVASADIISFDFRGNGGPFDFETQTGVITTNGITMTFKAFDDTATSPKINAANFFGIDTTAVGEDPDTIDSGEYFTIEFSSSVYSSIELQAIDLGVFTVAGADVGTYQITGGSLIELNGDTTLAADVLDKTLTFV